MPCQTCYLLVVDYVCSLACAQWSGPSKSLYLNFLLEQLEVCRIHFLIPAIDRSIDFDNRFVAGRRNAEFFALARNHAADEFYLAAASFDVIVDRRCATAADMAH